MAIKFDHGRVDLAYANARSADLVDEYTKQLMAFRGEAGDIPAQRRDKSDLLMASRFPWAKQIRRWRRAQLASPNAKVGFEASFPGIESSAVFGETQYPGSSTIYPGRY